MPDGSTGPPDGLGATPGGDALSRQLAALRARPLRRTPPWHRVVWWGSVAVVVLGAITAALAVGSHHYDATVRNPDACPDAAAVNRFLGTTLGTVSVIHEGDLVSCSYPEAADGRQALAVDIDQPNTGIGANNAAGFGTDNPCKDRPPMTVAGLSGCDMTGAPGTAVGRPSLLVKDGQFDCQFTSFAPGISMEILERLAGRLIAGPPGEV